MKFNWSGSMSHCGSPKMVQSPMYGHFWWKFFPGDQNDQGIHVGDAGWVTGSLWDEDRAPRKPPHDEPFVDWYMIAKRNWFLSATLCIIHLSGILLWIHVLSFVLKRAGAFTAPEKKGVTWRDNVWKAPESGWEPIQNVPEVPQPRAIPPQKDVAFCSQGSVAYRHSNHSNQLCQTWPVLGKCWGWLMNRFSRLQEISFPSEDWAAILSLVWQNVQVHMFIVC